MEALFSDGRIVDIVIAFMIVEAIALLVAHQWGSRFGRLDIALLLVPGLFLLLAMRAALSGDGWQIMAVWLLAALIAHLADLARRLKRS